MNNGLHNIFTLNFKAGYTSVFFNNFDKNKNHNVKGQC